MFPPPITSSLTTGPEAGHAARAAQAANAAFASAYLRGRLGQVAAVLRQRPITLLDLATLMTTQTLAGQSSGGTQAVPVERICGSEHRAHEFDAAWRPLQDHTRERWTSVARANALGIALPPVDLIQLGDRYVVRDGHHRVSVARALGQVEIDAQITVWHTSEMPPWEQPSCRRRSVRDGWLGALRAAARVARVGRRRTAPAQPA